MKCTIRAGFTLTEVLLVIGIISLLAAIVTANLSDARAQARDAQRKSDLQTISAALELYKQRWGRYPEGCRGAGAWSGQNIPGVNNPPYGCPSNDPRYIMGDPSDGRPFTDFMAVLPMDPKLNGNNSGYIYITNADGTVYKFMTAQTVETEDIRVQDTHQFKACDVSFTSSGICDATYKNPDDPTGSLYGSAAPRCGNGNPEMRRSYAVWSGFPEEIDPCSGQQCEDKLEQIACRMP